jgi:heptosyltransferase-2
LAAALPGTIVVVGGPEDREAGRDIAARDSARIHSAAGELSLRASAALIERATMLVSNDSAPLHLAGAVGTPVVAIFGPTVPAFGFGPLGLEDSIVELEGLSCRPCSTHGPMKCPLGHHRCMVDLRVHQVLESVTSRLNRPASLAPSLEVRSTGTGSGTSTRDN